MNKVISAVDRAREGVEAARRNLEEALRALERAEAMEKHDRKLMRGQRMQPETAPPLGEPPSSGGTPKS